MDLFLSITSGVNIHDRNQLNIELHHLLYMTKSSREESEILSVMGWGKLKMIT